MNNLRNGSWAGLAGGRCDPKGVRFGLAWLLAKDLRRISRDHLPNLIYDWQSYMKRSANTRREIAL